MNHTCMHLKEQKYLGIRTKVLFADHDETDFRQQQIDVLRAGIANIDFSEHFLALDSDFSEESFCYTPLVPVTAFEGEGYFRFTRAAGDYYCFEVTLKELGPQWFQACFAYMEQHDLKIDHAFDLEFYPLGYMEKLVNETFALTDQTICLIFRKAD